MRRLFPLSLIAGCVVLLAGNAPAVGIYPTADMTTIPTGSATARAYPKT